MERKRYYGFHDYLQTRFGSRVHKVSIDAGFTCPNIDGHKSTGGCTYCNNAGFSFNTRRPGPADVTEQLRTGMDVMRRRFKAQKFIAYFQAFSNTYAPIDRLRSLYDAALLSPDVVALAAGTRSDCVSPSVLQLLDSYTATHEVWIEYGLQTSHDRTLRRVNRCEVFADFQRAIAMTAKTNLKVCVHLILGLPGESLEDMLETADRLRELPHHSLKLHLLHIMRDTQMATEYAFGGVPMMVRAEYVNTVVRVLERIRPDVSLQRLSADAPLDILIAPMWCLDKVGIRNDIEAELERRGTWQGKALGCPRDSIGKEYSLTSTSEKLAASA